MPIKVNQINALRAAFGDMDSKVVEQTTRNAVTVGLGPMGAGLMLEPNGIVPTDPDTVDIPGGFDIDWSAMLDMSQCETQPSVCDEETLAALSCVRISSRVPIGITSKTTRITGRDFVQGARTAQQLFSMLPHMTCSRPARAVFYPGIPTDGTGQRFAIGWADPWPDTVTTGFVVTAAQQQQLSTFPTATMIGDGLLEPTVNPCAAPRPFGLADVAPRGRVTAPLQLTVRGQLWAAHFPWMWRRATGMETARAEICHNGQLPQPTADFVRASWAPSTAAGTPLWGAAVSLVVTAPVTDVRVFPIGPNTPRVADIVNAVYAQAKQKLSSGAYSSGKASR